MTKTVFTLTNILSDFLFGFRIIHSTMSAAQWFHWCFGKKTALHLDSVCICRRPQICRGRPPGVHFSTYVYRLLGKRTSVCWWHSCIHSSGINVGKVHFCKATENLQLSVSLGEKFRFNFSSQCCFHAVVKFRHKNYSDKVRTTWFHLECLFWSQQSLNSCQKYVFRLTNVETHTRAMVSSLNTCNSTIVPSGLVINMGTW